MIHVFPSTDNDKLYKIASIKLAEVDLTLYQLLANCRELVALNPFVLKTFILKINCSSVYFHYYFFINFDRRSE